tara:strand:- start:63 stop:224 length:162 start_codon:yes stop_codon:yes gene_type:complete
MPVTLNWSTTYEKSVSTLGLWCRDQRKLQQSLLSPIKNTSIINEKPTLTDFTA